MKKTLATITIAGSILLAAYLTSGRTIIWDGRVTRPIEVTVMDVEGKAISNATVMLIEAVPEVRPRSG